MRLGQNPAKSIDKVPQPRRVTVAVLSYLPFLNGYYAEGLEVLKSCLGSLQQNTPEPYDLLVFDNGSCEEVREYLQQERQAGKIQFLILADQNYGKGGAWNFIFQGAPGEFIAYADSDIRFYPGWLTKTLEILDAYPQAGMVTARPVRTPETFYTNTLAWARSTPEVTIEQGTYIPWEIYLEHVLSLGTSEEQAREWYASRKDTRLTYRGIQALVGAAHFQFTVRKRQIQLFLPFQMDRPMGQVRSLDDQMNEADCLRLTTTEPLVKHMGNRISDDEGAIPGQRPARSKRLVDAGPVRRSLLWAYDRIFKLYFSNPAGSRDEQ